MNKQTVSVSAEKSVLGMCLVSKFGLAESISYLRADDFFDPKHNTIFAAMASLDNKGTPVDITTITNELNTSNRLEAVGGVPYLMELANSIASSANISAYTKIVSEKATARKMMSAADRVKDLINNSTDEMGQIIASAEKEILNVTRRQSGGSFRESNKLVQSVLEGVKTLEENVGDLPGARTSYGILDEMTGGFQPGDYVILAARPSMGKTALALNFMERVAQHNTGGVALFSLEMPAEQIIKRMISSAASINQSLLRKPHEMSADEKKRMYLGADQISKRDMWIDDTPALKISELMARSRKLCAEHKIEMIVIDYLTLITPNTSSGNRVNEVGEISRNLKALARELEVPIIVLSQLSRKVEERPNKRPIMSDLRESGAIEQDADLVMFLYRDKYYNEESERGNIAELIIRKHRNGPTGTIDLNFSTTTGQFTD